MEVRTKRISKKPITIIPLGDIQYDGSHKSIAYDHLLRDVEAGVKAGAYFIGMGDYIDFMSPSNRRRLDNANLYDTALKVIEHTADELNQELFDDILKETKGRWIGLLEGHHYAMYGNGETSDQRLAAMLGTELLGTSCMIEFIAGKKASEKLKFFAAHGVGSGYLPGAVFNRIHRVYTHLDDVDMVLWGHWTQRGAKPAPPRLGLVDGKLQEHLCLYIPTGGYSRGYIEGNRHGQQPRGTYVEQAHMNPVQLGCVQIHWTPGVKPAKVLV